ncbi:MAG: hypothetical protein KAH09_06425, partial [Desulfobacula sp.]|nr:hypothetical protein [Desulfobacula sp.]
KNAKWLTSAIPFTQYKLFKSSFIESIFNEILPILQKNKSRKLKDKKLSCLVLLTNLFKAKTQPIRISLGHNKFSVAYPTMKYSSFMAVLNIMIEIGFIGKHLAPVEFDAKKGHKKRTHKTCLSANDELITLMDKMSEEDKAKFKSNIYDQINEIRLSTPKRKPVGPPPKNTKKNKAREGVFFDPKSKIVVEMRERIRKINKVHSKFIFTHEGSEFYPAMYRVFTMPKPIRKKDKWKYGGRIYWAEQNIKRDERKLIRINGEPTIELDYSALHPSLLFAREGIQLDLNLDLYQDIISDMPPMDEADKKGCRKFIKNAFLYCLNAADEDEVKKAIWQDIDGEYKFYGLIEDHLKLGIVGVLEKIKTAYPKIEHFMFKGIGHELMHDDSEIAMDVVGFFTDLNIPCLPVHDSFLVPISHRDSLEETMKSVYKKHMGFDIKIT